MAVQIKIERVDKLWSVLEDGVEVARSSSGDEVVDLARVMVFSLKSAGVLVTMIAPGRDGLPEVVRPEDVRLSY